MTLTADRRVRATTRPARSGTVAPSAPPRPVVVSVRVLDDVYRVLEDGHTVGYVQLAGPVYVSLLGEVYNTSVEIAQCLDLDTAVDHLQRARS